MKVPLDYIRIVEGYSNYIVDWTKPIQITEGVFPARVVTDKLRSLYSRRVVFTRPDGTEDQIDVDETGSGNNYGSRLTVRNIPD